MNRTSMARGGAEKAPSLRLPLADGGEFSLDALRGQPVLVTFLSHAA